MLYIQTYTLVEPKPSMIPYDYEVVVQHGELNNMSNNNRAGSLVYEEADSSAQQRMLEGGVEVYEPIHHRNTNDTTISNNETEEYTVS